MPVVIISRLKPCFVRDYELNAVILDVAFRREMEKMFEEDLKQSEEITLEAWRSRGHADRAVSLLAGLFGYWLWHLCGTFTALPCRWSKATKPVAGNYRFEEKRLVY